MRNISFISATFKNITVSIAEVVNLIFIRLLDTERNKLDGNKEDSQ